MQGVIRRASPQGGCIIHARPAAVRPQRLARLPQATTNSSNPEFERFVRGAKKKVDQFVEEKQLKSKAQQAFKQVKLKAQEMANEVGVNFERTVRKLDSEYDVTDKTRKAAKRMEESLKDLDQEYSIRRKLRSMTQDVQRSFPKWRRRFDEFAATRVGGFTIMAGMIYLVTTPFFWSVLNFLMLLWWVVAPIALFLLQRAVQQQASQQEELRRQQQQNPFGDMFKGFWTGDQQQQRGHGQSRSSNAWRSEGPIIDAEWVSLDDDDSKSNGTGRKRR